MISITPAPKLLPDLHTILLKPHLFSQISTETIQSSIHSTNVRNTYHVSGILLALTDLGVNQVVIVLVLMNYFFIVFNKTRKVIHIRVGE